MSTSLYEERSTKRKIPRTFIERRLHSLLGLWLIIFLFEHLLINAQASLYFFDQGNVFISMVNKIHGTFYLKAIEIVFLALPFLFHGIWGVAYLRSAKHNSFPTDGTTPSLPQYKKNRAFTWQRITSWILLVGILAHVIHMRFIDYPMTIQKEGKPHYFIIQKKSKTLNMMKEKLHLTLTDHAEGITLKKNEVLVETPSLGSAFLVVVRETFTHPMMVILYSILVISACFHAYNGLWTAMITWGVVVAQRSQDRLRRVTVSIMLIVMTLGLLAAWGPYFL